MASSHASSPTQDAPLRDGLHGMRLILAATAIYIGTICSTLDMAILQNALPSMTREMHLGASDAVWIITLYMLVTLTLLLPFAPLSDRIGYRQMYLSGVVVFIVASLVCGLSSTVQPLLAGRFLQGIGAAAMMGSSTSLIRLVYPKRLIARAVGTNSTVVAVSLAAAPSFSALILLHLSWNWLFLINIPLGATALIAGIRSLPKSSGSTPAGAASATPPASTHQPQPAQASQRTTWAAAVSSIDWPSVLLNMGFFTLLLLGTEGIGTHPISGVAMLVTGAVLGTFFVRRQIGRPNPMLPLELLGERRFGLTIATSFTSFATQGAAFVALPFYLQRSLHFDTQHTAFILTAWPLTLALFAQVASFLCTKFSVAALCAVGQALMAAGLGLIISGLVPPTVPVFIALLAVSGAGFGLFQTPNNYVIVSSAPPNKSGSVGALRAATRIAGQLMGSAFCGLAFLLADTTHAFDGPRLGVAMAAAMALLACILSASRGKTPARTQTS